MKSAIRHSVESGSTHRRIDAIIASRQKGSLL